MALLESSENRLDGVGRLCSLMCSYPNLKCVDASLHEGNKNLEEHNVGVNFACLCLTDLNNIELFLSFKYFYNDHYD